MVLWFYIFGNRFSECQLQHFTQLLTVHTLKKFKLFNILTLSFIGNNIKYVPSYYNVFDIFKYISSYSVHVLKMPIIIHDTQI